LNATWRATRAPVTQAALPLEPQPLEAHHASRIDHDRACQSKVKGAPTPTLSTCDPSHISARNFACG
jgi:hypothetical protein